MPSPLEQSAAPGTTSDLPDIPRRRSPRLAPAQTVFLAFALAALTGMTLLRLPMASVHPGEAHWSDAAFVAISALCVTGLSTVDTATYWTPFGKVVIIILIQLGGLGVMTFATGLGMLVLRRVSITTKISTASEKGGTDLSKFKSAIGWIIKITACVEITVGLILTLRFWLHYGYDFPKALAHGFFHSVSAFNNAGFALYSDNIMGFVGDPWITMPICAAIIVGGLGFPVIMQLIKYSRIPMRWTMNTRLVLVSTVVLLILGTALIALIEWNNPKAIGNLSPMDRIEASFFQSVQTRTAGFNSVDIGQLHPVTWLFMDILMLIGGGPAGTAGGIKVTTFGVLFFILLTELRGDTAVNIFGKRLSRSVHRQAIAVVLLSIAAIMLSTAFLMFVTPFAMDKLLFEVVSAFATVGLSTGITAAMPVSGKIVLMLLMFIGRLGPITFATALALRKRTLLYELPKERPIIG